MAFGHSHAMGSARMGHSTSRDLHNMAIMSLPILGRGDGGWSHLRRVVLLKQNYHLYTMKCVTQSEATTQGRVHHAELVMTMWFTAFLANNQIS